MIEKKCNSVWTSFSSKSMSYYMNSRNWVIGLISGEILIYNLLLIGVGHIDLVFSRLFFSVAILSQPIHHYKIIYLIMFI